MLLCDTLIGSTSLNLLLNSFLYLLESVLIYICISGSLTRLFHSSFLKVYILIGDICYIEIIPPNLLELFKTREYFDCFSTIMSKPT